MSNNKHLDYLSKNVYNHRVTPLMSHLSGTDEPSVRKRERDRERENEREGERGGERET